MSLVTGAKLGPYEIVAPLGAGGMGEVYRARDARLGRDVAVKVLPASLSADAERLRRFEQEARAAGLLSHPGITAVFDVGTHEGAPYLVQELLEGETLRAALAGGRLSARTAVDYAIQIARGLAAAHEKGIVHRDLKPENLFVTRDGRVKILDFGLAKLTGAGEKGSASSLPTATPGTEAGVVMGTLGYMSPEQVRGQAADARSDIFSLGAILHEMLSGARPFRGESAADTMSAILREDPPELSATSQGISPGLGRIVRHCLEKNAEQRFQSARDLAFDLEALSTTSSSLASAMAVRADRLSRLRVPALVGLAALALGLVGGRLLWRPPAPSPVSYKRLSFGRGPVASARFAPDGETIVYAASWDGARQPQLYSTRKESPESLALALREGDVRSISRSGEMLILKILHRSYGYAEIGTLSQAPLSGSAARPLLEDVGDADWAPDGESMTVVRAPGWRYRLEYPVGKVLYETTGWISHPRVSPGGDVVAFLDHPVFGDDRGSVALVDRAGKKKTLTPEWGSVQGVAWLASGKEIWFTATDNGLSRALHAVTPKGRLRQVAAAPGGMLLQDVSRDGRVLFAQENVRLGLLALLPGETRPVDASSLDWAINPILSEDGKTLVYTEQGEGGGEGYSVYLRRLDGSPAVRLGEGDARAISPDGKLVLSTPIRTSPRQMLLLSTGAGQPRPLPPDAISHSEAAFLPDGRRILFVGNEPGRPPRDFIQGLQGGAPRAVTPEGSTGTVISPDGRAVVVRDPEGSFSLHPLDGGSPHPLPGLGREDRPLRFSADGRRLYVGGPGEELPARVYRVDLASGRRELVRELAPRDPAATSTLMCSAISPDGRTLVYFNVESLGRLYLAEGLR
jgi:eukaryotic-like serine/threonine-protein kinase